MKTTGLVLVLMIATLAHAQGNVAGSATPGVVSASESNAITHPVVKGRPVTYADRYCSGFIMKQQVARTTFIAGDLNSPHATKLGTGDVVFISGPKLQVGTQLTILREMRDPNHAELFNGQYRLIREIGQVYADLGRVRVVDTRQKMAIGIIEFGCKAAVPGDLLVPFVERPEVPVPAAAALDRFAPASGGLTGRIVMAQDYDSLLGVGQKVYLSLGSLQHVKTGDVFRVYRAPQEELRDELDALSYKSSMLEDSQKYPARIRTGGLSLDPEFFDIGRGPKVKVADFPRHILGEVVVLHVTPSSATGMITVALEDIHPGDSVEAEGKAPAVAER